MKNSKISYVLSIAIAAMIVFCGDIKSTNNNNVPAGTNMQQKVVMQKPKTEVKTLQLEYNKTYRVTLKNVGYQFLDVDDDFPISIKKCQGATLTFDYTYYKDHTCKIEVTQSVPNPKQGNFVFRNFKMTLESSVIGDLEPSTYSQFGKEVKVFALETIQVNLVDPIKFYTNNTFTKTVASSDMIIPVAINFDDAFGFVENPGLLVDENNTVYGDLRTLRKKINPLGTFSKK